MFHYNGNKRTIPNCPVRMIPDFNPTSGAQSYDGSDKYCTSLPVYRLPFWLKNLGPKYSEWTINAHEAQPGHHLQVRKRNMQLTLTYGMYEKRNYLAQ